MSDFISQLFSPANLSLSAAAFQLLTGLFINSIVVWLIVHFFYYPKGRRRDYYFTFVLLSAHDMGIGAALGLFAIFGIIRYRTESVPIREMTYLFFLVALSVINGKCDTVSLLEQLLINSMFLICVWLCERFLTSNEGCKYVKYDNIDLIKPERYDELKADLEARLGLKITHIEVGAVDFLTDMTMLRVYYIDSENHVKSVDRQLKIPQD